ncbi:hypothetical protein CRG98_030395 [Punica granatum]|uniref:Retrotransposon gag domain-containing protein n=1 Tax=Punica granatum TaxID=22663 RepID=A0A2I0J0J1_PUNGR|nr:hypothetical protein CRG98_030395 [Punica granatum]
MDRPAPCLRLEAITPPRQDIMRIWRTLRPVDRAFIQGIIGDMVMFTETPMDWIFLRTAIEFWDPEHAVFNFQGTKLAPTIKQYTALIQRPTPTTQGIFVPNPFTTIRSQLSNLLGIPTQEIHQELHQGWDHGIRIAWLSDWTLLRALTPSTASYQRDACHGFLLLVFGTLVFLTFPSRRTAYPIASSGPTPHPRPPQDSCRFWRSTVNRTLAAYIVFTSPSTPPTKSEHSLPHQHTWPGSIHRDRHRRNGPRPSRLPELHLPLLLKPKAPPKRLCAQNYGPSGRNEIGSVASLLTLAQRSRTTGSFRRSKLQLASHRYPIHQRLRMTEEDRVDISEEVNPPIPTHSQPSPAHAPPPPTPAGILPAYSGAPPTHLPPSTSSGAPLPPVSLTSSASDNQARITALEGTVNQMTANMAELLALLRGPNRASSSFTPPPRQGPTVDPTPWVPPTQAPENMDAPAPPTLHTSMAHPFTSPFSPPPAPTTVPLPPVAFLTSNQVLFAPPPVSMPAPAAIYTVPPPMVASPTHFFPEADDEQERRLKRMEETIRALQASDTRPDARYGDCSLFPGMRLPPKFKITEFKTYGGTTDPRHHLRHYRGKMLQYWGYEEFVIHSFQDSLSGSALDWFMSLKAEDIPTWADLSRKFIDQYQYCAEAPPTLLELSTKEMARGQRGINYSHLLAHTSSFSNPIEAGKKLDLGIKLGRMEGPTGKGEESSNKVPATTSSSSGRRGKEVSVNAVNPAQPTPQQYSVNFTTSPTAAPAYFPPPLQHQHHSVYYSAPPGPPPMASQPFDHHYAPSPTSPRPLVSRGSTHLCLPLFLTYIDNSLRAIRSDRYPQARILTRPFRINLNAASIIKDNPLPDHRPSSGPSINMIFVCTSGRDEDVQDNPLLFVIDYTPEEPTVGFVGHKASSTPFVVDVPAREPVEQQFSVMGVTRSGRVYENPAAKDKGKAPATEVAAAPESSPFPSKRVTEEEVEVFVKIIKASDYKVVEQLAKSPAHISLLALLLGSKPHREALLRVLTAAQMNVDLNRVRPSKTAVRAFDGSRREVLDIPNAFSLLLGRPWIHSASAVPSSLHQRLKFIVEEKLITVKGEEDYAIYKETEVPYISVGDDENLPFHSFETISVIRDYGEIGPSRTDRMIGKPAGATISTAWPHTMGGSTGALQFPRYPTSSPDLHTLSGAPLTAFPRTSTTLLLLRQPWLPEDSQVPEIEVSLRRLEDHQITSVEPTEEINVGTEEEPRTLKIGTALDPRATSPDD